MTQSLWEHKYDDEATTMLFYLKLKECLKVRASNCLLPPPNQQNIDLNKLYKKASLAVNHNDFVYIPHVSLMVSMQCTLKCRDCSVLSPYYKSKVMNLDEVYAGFLNLTDSIDYVNTVFILGGEPLLQKKLPELLKMVLKSEKLGKVQIISNGTLFPSPELIDIISNNPRVDLVFSRYKSDIAPKFNEIVAFCRKNKINLHIRASTDHYWTNFYKFASKHKNINPELTFNLCAGNKCKEVWHGRLYFCFKPAVCEDLDFLTARDNEFVDLLNTSAEERREKIFTLYRNSNFRACLSCAMSHDSPKLPAAVQTKKPDLEKLRIDFKQQLAVLGID